MIRSFRHPGLREFHRTGSVTGIQPKQAAKLRLQLSALEAATRPMDLAAPGWRLHPLHGAMRGHWAVSVSGHWRLTFRFVGTDVELVDYLDYH